MKDTNVWHAGFGKKVGKTHILRGVHSSCSIYIYKYLMASYMLESNLQSLLNLLVPNMGVGQSYYYHILREYTSIKPAISGT